MHARLALFCCGRELLRKVSLSLALVSAELVRRFQRDYVAADGQKSARAPRRGGARKRRGARGTRATRERALPAHDNYDDNNNDNNNALMLIRMSNNSNSKIYN